MDIKQHASYFKGQSEFAERLREILHQTGFDLKFDFLVAVYPPNINSYGSEKENVTTDTSTVLYSIWHATDKSNCSGIKPDICIRELGEIPSFRYGCVYCRHINPDTIQFAIKHHRFEANDDFVLMVNTPYASYHENICHDYLEDSFSEEWTCLEPKTFLACILKNFLHETIFHFSENRSAQTYIFNLFEQCVDVQSESIVTHLNVISAMAYEKQSNSGKILFVPSSKKPQMDIVFEEPISLSQRKKSRKLFEISTGDAYLVSDTEYIYGIITFSKLPKNSSNIILAEIYNPLSWELKRLKEKNWLSLIAFTGDHYCVNRTDNIKTSLEAELGKIDIDKSEYDSEKMRSIIEAASKQAHGTTIVFTKKAAEEASRLDSTSFKIAKTPLTAEVTRYVTAIDGAVLCDFQGNCHAIGVILDGIELQELRKKNTLLKADISRGARYNSAVRYKCKNKDSIICIVSEDGGYKLI